MDATFSELAVDRPLTDPAADTLGRVAFADRITAELLAWNGREPLVVSLNGEPGCGKTTMKNFIVHRLAAMASAGKAPIAIELNPWQSVSRDPAFSLCRDVAEQLDVGDGSSARAALALAWRRLATALSSEGGATPNACAEPAGPTLRTLRDTIRDRLHALPAPLILFVDDLDRLPPEEMRAFTRSLEANTSLPNCICFLLVSQGAVVPALGGGVPGAGAEELRKLVQIELEMPDAPEPLLRRDLEQGLAAILDAVSFPARPRERWSDVFSAALWPLFCTPRDVKRFLSAFAFQFSGHFDPGERVLEVNPIDLVILEALRMFAHPIYVEMREAFRRRETRVVRLTSGRDEERRAARLEIDQIVETLPLSARERRAVTLALQDLLPGGTGGVHGCREDWDRDLRLCSARHAERYFHLGTGMVALPARRLIQIVRGTADRARMEALLLQASTDNVLSEALERLPPLLETLPEPDVAATSCALGGICDQIPAGAPEDLENRLIRLASELFARLQNPLKRENIMTELLEDSTRLTGPILLLHQLRPRSDAPTTAGTTSVTIEQFRRLVKPAVARLQSASSDGSIWRSREYGALIRRWWEWTTNKDEIRQWLLQQTKEPDHARAWLRTFVGPSPTAQPREMVLQLEDLSQFCDPAPIAACAAKAAGDGIDRAAVRILAQALSPKGTSAGFALRTLVMKLEEEAA